jgi:cytochrome c oxidase assembly protein subunit 11
VEAPDLSREIRVEFVTTVNSYAPFDFGADADSMTVNPGKMYYATFTAKNLTDEDKIAQAVPSVAPGAAAEHFVKIECFCFDQQTFLANEERAMPLQFIVDPELPDYVDTITLQYTFFDTARVATLLRPTRQPLASRRLARPAVPDDRCIELVEWRGFWLLRNAGRVRDPYLHDYRVVRHRHR